MKATQKLITKWRKILFLDNIWTVSLELGSEEEMDQALAFVDTSNAEYFVATVILNDTLLNLEEDIFIEIVNEILCHELTHLVMADFLRSALILAEGKPDFQQELRYKFEQHTTRLQRAFMDLDTKIADQDRFIKSQTAYVMGLAKSNIEKVKEEPKTKSPKKESK